MKKSSKRLVGALATAASVASVIAPAANVLAAEKVNVDFLVAKIAEAKQTKRFGNYNEAKQLIQQLPAEEQTKYLLEIIELDKVVFTPTILSYIEKVNAYAVNSDLQNLQDFEDLKADILANIADPIDQGYFLGQMNGWGASKVYTLEVVAALNAVDNLWSDNSAEAVKAAEAAVAKVANAKSVAWLNAVKTKAVEAGKLVASSVNATNPKQVVVNFNKAIDENTITADNVKVYIGTSTTAAAWTYSLSEDGKVVTLGLSASQIPQDTKVKVVVENVATESEEKVAKTELTSVLKDTTAPSVISAKFTSSKTIEVELSEPLQLETNAAALHVMSNVLIDGKKLVGSIAQDLDSNKLIVTLGTKLAVGDHTIKVTGYRDFSGWLASDFEVTGTVVEDKTAPSIVAVEAGRTSMKVTFDEPVSTLGNITVNGYTYTSGTTTDSKTFEITFQAGYELGLAYLVTGEVAYYGTTDMEGNVKASSTTPAKFTFKATDEVELPTATVVLDDSNNVIITYSEKMSNQGKVTVKKADGTVVAKDVVPVLKDAATYTYKVSAAAAKLDAVTSSAKYTVTLSGAKDNTVRQNTIVETTTEVAPKDIVAPAVTSAVLTQAHTTKVVNSVTMEDKAAQATVYFSEAMDVATVENANNYTVSINGSSTPVNLSSISGVTLKAADDAKSVVITFPGTGTNGVTAGATTSTDIYALLVKDAAGNIIATTPTTGIGFNQKIDVAAAAATLTLDEADAGATANTYGTDKVVMVAKNKIKVGFSNPMSTIDPSDFVVFTTSTTTNVKLVGVAYELSTDGKVATITLNGDLTADGKVASTDGSRADFYLRSNGSTVDVYGNNVAAATQIEGASTNNASAKVVIADYVSPTLVSMTDGVDGTAADNKFTLKFDEAVLHTLTAADDIKNDLIIKDKDGKILANNQYTIEDIKNDTNETQVTVTINNGVLSNGVQSLSFQLLSNRYLQDANGNFAAPFTTSIDDLSFDAVVPTATVSVVKNATTGINAGDAIKLTFSEATNKPTLSATDVTILNSHTLGTTPTFVWNADGTELTITLDATTDLAASDTIKFTAANKVEDLVGNDFGNAVFYTVSAADFTN